MLFFYTEFPFGKESDDYYRMKFKEEAERITGETCLILPQFIKHVTRVETKNDAAPAAETAP